MRKVDIPQTPPNKLPQNQNPSQIITDAKRVIQLQYIYYMEVPVNKTATITVRLDPQVKKNAEAVLKALGLTTTQAVNLFFTQVSLIRGFLLMCTSPTRQLQKPLKMVLPDAACIQLRTWMT